MKKYRKKDVETIVDDNDPRIPSYLANGWTEVLLEHKVKSEYEKNVDKVFEDIKNNGLQHDVESKPLNEALSTVRIATAENKEVDDGLFKAAAPEPPKPVKGTRKAEPKADVAEGKTSEAVDDGLFNLEDNAWK